MKNFRKSWAIVLIVVFIFTICAVSNVSASSIMQTVNAYRGVKIFYNGQELTGEKQPYIINDTTYVPLRMLMENIGSSVVWDPVNYRVVVTDNSDAKDAKIAELENRILQLQAIIDELEDSSRSIDDIEEAVSDAFEDAGDDYFDDDGIELHISLSGDEDDLYYSIKMDFDDANDYDDLKDLYENDIEDFLDDVESEIYDQTDGTDYEDADVTGKLIDYDYSSYYVKYNGSSYTYSWEDYDDLDLDDLEDTLYEEFEDAGEDYFGDDGIVLSIRLSGDEDDLYYSIKMDFDDADYYDDLSDVDEDDIEDFLNDLEEEIYAEIDNTEYEDADLTGKLIDNDYSSLYVESEDGDYDFNL